MATKQQPNKQRPGPKAEILVVDGDWRDVAGQAMARGKPPATPKKKAAKKKRRPPK